MHRNSLRSGAVLLPRSGWQRDPTERPATLRSRFPRMPDDEDFLQSIGVSGRSAAEYLGERKERTLRYRL